MVYIIPQPHKCPKCGYECKYGPHDHHDAPVFTDGPTCTKCWEVFVKAHCGIMVQLPFKSSSELAKEKREEFKKKGICPECDPPGCGQECRGGPCYTCKGTGKYPP